MGLHKGLDIYTDVTPTTTRDAADPWRFPWPNTADFNFNYYRLLINANETGIARVPSSNPRVAIIGTGVAGLTAARELFRSGYTRIHMLEASNRIGGRTYSIPVPGQQWTAYEMGAMRMPFFIDPQNPNCVLGYYRQEFSISSMQFPNPGVVKTGIYMNNGYGPNISKPYEKPTLDVWQKEPNDPTLLQIYLKWKHFADSLTTQAQGAYAEGGAVWQDYWQRLVSTYWTMNFRDLVYLPPASEYGNVGGLGLTEDEANIFYVIGAGDGSWGAFYDVSALYPIRTLLFGYGTNHQLIMGRYGDDGAFLGGPEAGAEVKDSAGTTLAPPAFKGVQTFADCLFYMPVQSAFVPHMSLYEAASGRLPDLRLFTSMPARTIRRLPDGRIQVLNETGSYNEVFDAVIVTVPTWALQNSVQFEGFSTQQLPATQQISIRTSHWITSCKVFLPLKQRYWSAAPGTIPQVIATDTFLQDIYAYAVGDDPGVVLISYTWEDDATKLVSEDDQVLARRCVAELDRILAQTGYPAISPYIDTSQQIVIHWERQPTYRGCAKLYRERSWDMDYALLAYNQDYSAASGLYFAGEAFSVEGGWTEPALRLGLDAVLHVVKNTGGAFLNGFDMQRDYPRHSSWSPASPSPRTDEGSPAERPSGKVGLERKQS